MQGFLRLKSLSEDFVKNRTFSAVNNLIFAALQELSLSVLDNPVDKLG
jgi:hypothetical protein